MRICEGQLRFKLDRRRACVALGSRGKIRCDVTRRNDWIVQQSFLTTGIARGARARFNLCAAYE